MIFAFCKEIERILMIIGDSKLFAAQCDFAHCMFSIISNIIGMLRQLTYRRQNATDLTLS